MGELRPSAFGLLLWQQRAEAGLTQEDLAERARLSARVISDLERGVSQRPHLSTVHQLAEALELTGEDRAHFERTARGTPPPFPAALAQHAPAEPVPGPPPTNLPDEPTPFIGRETEIAALVELVGQPDYRLVTLTGTPGTGKTRLALQVGHALLHRFRDGVFVVSLAPLADPALVPGAVASVLGVQETGGTDLLATLSSFLTKKHLLLVLDNFEHLLAASPIISSLLDASRELHILATSRSPLHLIREHEWPVPPLAVPDTHQQLEPEQISGYDSVALFVERARAVRPDFQLAAANAPAVAEICRKLDGLPLAIELAAARIRLFPLSALVQQLSHRLNLLSDPSQDRPQRHRTLRGAIDWSYSLLSNEERALFARLSVFSGGCSFEAAQAVCDAEGELDLLETIGSLVEKSLLHQVGVNEPRFAMLETIKEYAGEKLAERGEREQVRTAHAAYYASRAEEAEPQLRGAEQKVWHARLERENDNFRAAMRWSLQSGSQVGLRLAAALKEFWYYRGHLTEGRRWLEALLAAGREGEQDAALWAKALNGAGSLAAYLSDLDRAEELIAESLRLRQELDDTRGIVGSLLDLGLVACKQSDWERAERLWHESFRLAQELGDRLLIMFGLARLGSASWQRGDLKRTRELFEESLRLGREAGDTRAIALYSCFLAALASDQGELERAEVILQQSLPLARELGNPDMVAMSVHSLGVVAYLQGQWERARELFEENLRLERQLASPVEIAVGLSLLGLVAVKQQDEERAIQLQDESLRLNRAANAKRGIAYSLVGFAAIAGFRQEHERATQLLGAADTIWTWTSVVDIRHLCYRQAQEELSRIARAVLGDGASEAVRCRGQAMSLEDAVAFALDGGRKRIRSDRADATSDGPARAQAGVG